MVANIAHLRLSRKSFSVAVRSDASPDATTRFDDVVAHEWARRWPCEEIWKARKRA
jgi:hypothetical protein